MFARSLVVMVVTALLIAADAKEDATKDDMKKLDGTWLAVSVEEAGKQAPEEETKKFQFTFASNKVKGREGPEATFSIDPTKKPKQIDMKVGALEIKGIYSFDGDTLKMCLVKEAKKERPTDFTTQQGDGRGLFVFKREKK